MTPGTLSRSVTTGDTAQSSQYRPPISAGVSDYTGPHRGGGAFGHRLELHGPLAARLLEGAEGLLGQVPAELGEDAAGMDRRGADIAVAEAAIELDGEQHVCGLRAAVRHPGVVGRASRSPGSSRSTSEKRWPADDRLTMRAGAPARRRGANRLTSTKWPRWLVPNWVSKPSAGRPLRARHDAGVGDQHVEHPTVGDEAVGARPDRCQRGEVGLAHLDAGLDACGGEGRLGLGHVAGDADDRRAPGCQRPDGLDAEARRRAGDEHAEVAEVTVTEDVVGGGVGAEGRHVPHLARVT